MIKVYLRIIFESIFNKKKRKFFLLLFSLSFILIYNGCAKQVPPSGGPVDKTPPTVIASIPFDGTTNFTGDEISVTFSEYIDKNTFRNAFFISPVVKNVKYDWSGRTVTILLLDSLKKNTTYSIIIGTDIKDLNNKNRMALPYAFSFSTGDKIDKGKISGRVFDKNPQGTAIFIYRNPSDTLTPARVKPDYISQTGKKGEYLVTGLGNGNYRAFAVRDKNSDFLWNSETEEIGIQNKPIVLKDTLNNISGINFKLTVLDTSKPALLEATMTDRNHIMSVFSKRIDSSKVSSDKFTIFDSTENIAYPILYSYNKSGKGRKILLELNDSLKENRLFLLTENLFDYYGNKSEKEQVEFYYNAKPDTIKPSVEKIVLPYKKRIAFSHPNFVVRFSEGICSNNLSSDINFTDGKGRKVPISVKKINDAEFLISAKRSLHPNEKAELKILMNGICDAAGNKGDSTFRKKITAINDLDFVSISGKIQGCSDKKNNYVVLETLEKKGSEQKALVDNDGKYLLKQVLPGKYFIWVFEDINSNGNYDYGNIFPFKLAEPFYFRTDTLIVRKRWPIKNVNIKFK